MITLDELQVLSKKKEIQPFPYLLVYGYKFHVRLFSRKQKQQSISYKKNDITNKRTFVYTPQLWMRYWQSVTGNTSITCNTCIFPAVCCTGQDECSEREQTYKVYPNVRKFLPKILSYIRFCSRNFQNFCWVRHSFSSTLRGLCDVHVSFTLVSNSCCSSTAMYKGTAKKKKEKSKRNAY